MSKEIGRRQFIQDCFFKPLYGLAAKALLPPLLKNYAPQIEQQADWVPHWDGDWKRRHSPGGLKFVFIPGITATSDDIESFAPIKEQLYGLGYDEHDVLDISYKINENNPLLGEEYNSHDSSVNPLESVKNIEKLIDKYRKDFPEDRLVFIGHSQGGYISYELTRRNSDKVAAVISLDGALKGADIVPTPVEQVFAPIIAGEAGSYFLERGSQTAASGEVENEVARLVSQGVHFFSFASTDDLIVPPPFAYVQNSSKQIEGQEIETLFSMGTAISWPGSRRVKTILEKHQRYLRMLDPVEESYSAELKRQKQTVVGGFDGHGAVLAHQKVREGIEKIVRSLASQDNRPSERSAQIITPAGEEFLRRKTATGLLLNQLPYSGYNFLMYYDFDQAQFIIEIPKGAQDEALIEISTYLQSQGIEDLSWINNVTYHTR